MEKVDLNDRDALIIVDCQNDFLPKIGALPVPGGDEVIPELNRWIEIFSKKGLLIVATRDWHPKGHSSFREQGGLWPEHCVQGTFGAQFPDTLHLPQEVVVVSKGTDPEKDAYSGFDGTDLRGILETRGIERVFVGGLATDYCVKATVLDALKVGLQVFVIKDGVRGVDVKPNDSEKALIEMEEAGATLI